MKFSEKGAGGGVKGRSEIFRKFIGFGGDRLPLVDPAAVQLALTCIVHLTRLGSLLIRCIAFVPVVNALCKSWFDDNGDDDGDDNDDVNHDDDDDDATWV